MKVINSKPLQLQDEKLSSRPAIPYKSLSSGRHTAVLFSTLSLSDFRTNETVVRQQYLFQCFRCRVQFTIPLQNRQNASLLQRAISLVFSTCKLSAGLTNYSDKHVPAKTCTTLDARYSKLRAIVEQLEGVSTTEVDLMLLTVTSKHDQQRNPMPVRQASDISGYSIISRNGGTVLFPWVPSLKYNIGLLENISYNPVYNTIFQIINE